MTIMDTLVVNHFERKPDGTVWWGQGSWLVWGDIMRVKHLGGDRYEVTTEHWDCNEYMDLVKDEKETSVLHGAEVLELAFSEFPLWRYSYRH